MENHLIYYLETYTSSEIIAQTTTFTVWIVVLHHFFKIFLAFYFYEFKNGGKGNISISVYRISPIQRPHYITSSYTYQFFEKNIFCIVLRVKDC